MGCWVLQIPSFTSTFQTAVVVGVWSPWHRKGGEERERLDLTPVLSTERRFSAQWSDLLIFNPCSLGFFSRIEHAILIVFLPRSKTLPVLRAPGERIIRNKHCSETAKNGVQLSQPGSLGKLATHVQ